MLGFSGPGRALVMAVKEAVDNSLDSCEDIGVLPDIYIELADCGDNEVRLIVEDNGGGIPRDSVGSVFGELLYSSRFGVYKQTRGQQGIGISAIVLWSQKFLDEPATVRSHQPEDDYPYQVDISINEDGDDPYEIVNEDRVVWKGKNHGTRIDIPLRANWKLSYKIDQYLDGVSVANPHADITYKRKGETEEYSRSVEELPDLPEELPPHPSIVDIQFLENMIRSTPENNVWMFLLNEFPKVGRETARKILQAADIDKENPFLLDSDQKEELVYQLQNVDVPPPSDDCLQPLGKELIETSLSQHAPAFVGTSQRDAIVVDGHPLVVETGIAYGEDLPGTDTYRVANRVPLVYDGGACAITNAIENVNWDLYEIDQSDSGHPADNIKIFAHVCSTSVPFGTEAKTFISQRNVVVREVKLSLESCGRDVVSYIRDRELWRERKEKIDTLSNLYTSIATKTEDITGSSVEDCSVSLAKSCDAPLIDTGQGRVENPTDTEQEIQVGSEIVEIPPHDSVELSSGVDMGYGIDTDSINR